MSDQIKSLRAFLVGRFDGGDAWVTALDELQAEVIRLQSCQESMEAVCNLASEISLVHESDEADGDDDYDITFEVMPKLAIALREWRLKRNAQNQPQPTTGEQS